MSSEVLYRIMATPPRPNTGKISTYRVNQYWHVDVSYIEIRTGRVYYLQLVLDGLSRYIISWQINNEVSGTNTKKLLKLARARAKRLPPEFGTDPNKITSIVTDGGSKNDRNIVRSYLDDPIFALVIARQRVDFLLSWFICTGVIGGKTRLFQQNLFEHK